MTTDIVPAKGSNLDDRWRHAQALASADLLPKQYHNKPGNVLLAIEYGHALGLDAVTAIQQVHIIEGKPSASSQLISALVRRAGHRIRVTGDDNHAVAEIVRKDDPDFTFRSEWTIDRAARAGLCTIKDGRVHARTNNGAVKPWEAFTANMLKARAITEVARDACPEALAGVAYTPEELESATAVIDTAPVDVDTIDVEATEVEPAAEPSTDAAPCTYAQLRAMGAMFTKCKVKDASQRHTITALIIGHDVASAEDLTKAEAHKVIETIKPLAEAEDPEAAIAEWLNA